MKYVKLGISGLFVSEICLGTMQFGWTTDESHSRAVMDAFVEAGGTFIDTADIYTNWVGDLSYAGKTEEFIGRWLADRKNRSEIVLATKVRGRTWDGPNGEGLSRIHIVRACDESLRRLRTDCIDLYQCHWADLNTPIEETLSALNDLVHAGKVRYIGASNYPAWRLMEALAVSEKRGWVRFVSYQPRYSLMERQLFEYEALPLCRHHQLAVIPYSPLASGFLTGKYRRNEAQPNSLRAGAVLSNYDNDKSWAVLDVLGEVAVANGRSMAETALAWLLTNPLVTSPIIGANDTAQLEQVISACDYRLAADQMEKLNAATAWPRDGRPIWD